MMTRYHIVRYVFDSALFLGIVAAVANAIVAVFSILIWRVYKNQLATMGDALVETRKSNEATQESNRITEQDMIASNRAWLVLKELGDPGLTTGSPSKITLSFKNTGNVPAINVHVSAQWIARLPTQLDRHHPLPEQSEIAANDIVGSSEGYHVPFWIPALTADQSAAILSGEYKLLIYGKIGYSDCFKKPWSTEFCVMYDLVNDLWLSMPFYQEMV